MRSMPGSWATNRPWSRAVWVGYDNPRNLGSSETGGGLSLPIWINFMCEALRGVPVTDWPFRPAW